MKNCEPMDSTQSGNFPNCCPSSLTLNAECLPVTQLLSTENTDSTKLFLCKDAILRLPFHKKIKTYFTKNNFDLNIPFSQFVKEHTIDLLIIQEMAKIKWILVKKNKNRFYSLLYDGRFFDFVKEHWNLKVWTISKDGYFIQNYKKIQKVPKLNKTKKLKTKTPLWQLLHLSTEKEDPQTPLETVEFLKNVEKENNVSVRFTYKPLNYYQMWHQSFSQNECIEIEVFTTSDYSIGFRNLKIKKVKEKKMIIKEIPLQLPILPTQQNKSSSVNVKMAGLNEALNLGLINVDIFMFLSQELSKTVGTLHLELDNANNARYATYKDSETVFQIELKNENGWTKLFHLIFQQKNVFASKKESVLQNLLQTLTAFQTKFNNPYRKCLYSIQNCIKNFKLIMYADSDFSLHALKLHLAHFLNTHRKNLFLTLNSNAKNDITCIKNSEITVFNLYSYLEDADFLKCHLPPAHIQSTRLNFKHQKNQSASGLTTLKHCKQRGKSITTEVLKLYQKMASDFVQIFSYDVCSIPYLSLASLSFQVLWMQYSRLGGHYHQGIEKIKPYYENILRQYSQGGYYFSCKSKIEVNEPIHITYGNPASSLLELDIISSYGAASSNISTPTGFCYGYLFNDQNQLVRCDKLLRHTTFEFLSVFYTIDFLETEGYLIKTCYSNFHQTGIFSIANYPIDLVVICQDGKILLYQFDGQVNEILVVEKKHFFF